MNELILPPTPMIIEPEKYFKRAHEFADRGYTDIDAFYYLIQEKNDNIHIIFCFAQKRVAPCHVVVDRVNWLEVFADE